jgi:hypothetical protein
MGVRIRKSRLEIKGRCALTVVLAAGLLASVATVSASAATLNVTGTWQAVYHCTSGPCAGEAKSGTFTLTQAEGSSAVTGKLILNTAIPAEGTISGTLTGNTLELNGIGEKGYEAKGTEEISESGSTLTWNGDYMDNAGTSGTLTATRESTTTTPTPTPTPTPAAGLLPSATQVLCNLQVAFSNFVCTAQVGDAAASGTPQVPTGTVKFTAPKGAFESLPACSLVATPGSPNVASCAVTYIPPFGGIPTGTPAPVTAAYQGSTIFAESTGLPGAGAGVSPSTSTATASSSAVTTTVSCPAGTTSCPVAASLSAVKTGTAVAASKAKAKAKPKAKPQVVTLGGTEVTLSPGQKRAITVKLNGAGRKLLSSHKRLPALLRVSCRGIVIRSQKVQIKLGKGARAHKRG